MATNSAINLQNAGIVTYDGAGVYDALAIPLTVPNGGTGATSFLANAPICGGTTSTSALQTTATAGVAGQILFSNGAGALPSYQGINGFSWSSFTDSGNMGDGFTYFLRLNTAPAATGNTTSGAAMGICFIPFNCTLDSAYFWGRCTIAGSAENVTVGVRVNNTSNTNLTTTLQMNTTTYSFNATGVGLSLTKGDYLEVFVTTPAWVTNPTTIRYGITLFFT